MTTISEHAATLGVTRLCHLTPFRNLLHIAQGAGVLSVAELEATERAVFTQQDLERYDGHRDHISCSVEYPNVWYLRQKIRPLSRDQQLYPDWVCLFLSATLLDRVGAKFSPGNAAKAGGAFLEEGLEAFKAMYAAAAQGPYGPIGRGSKPESCPTDDQAEVMLPKTVPLAECKGVAVRDEEQASRIFGALDILSVSPEQFEWIVAPELFATGLSSTLRSGRLPQERLWTPTA